MNPSTIVVEDRANGAEPDVATFERLESNVRLYCRKFPAVFAAAKGAELFTEDGRRYLDFFCGAGALNYGHNPEHLKASLLRYIADDGITHGLDMYTPVKRRFLERFAEVVLEPRDLTYRVQFCGPTGADAVEAALKVARRYTGRTKVVSFMGAFHGMSRGALEVTGANHLREAGSVDSSDTTFVPYEDGPQGAFDSIGLLERMFTDRSSGGRLPAAVIVEPVQMEGGVRAASAQWLRELRALTERHDVLLIADEIQTGCGRAGSFFRFEQAGIQPDLVTLSKSVSGYGLPLSLLLLRPEVDVWHPGEHTGTFRANQLALVTATAALDLWADGSLPARIRRLEETLGATAEQLMATGLPVDVRQAGPVLGIDLGAGPRAAEVQRRCFTNGLLVELAGRDDEVVKVFPPLTITDDELAEALAILGAAISAA